MAHRVRVLTIGAACPECGVGWAGHERCPICVEPTGAGHVAGELVRADDTRRLCPSCAARVATRIAA